MLVFSTSINRPIALDFLDKFNQFILYNWFYSKILADISETLWFFINDSILISRIIYHFV